MATSKNSKILLKGGILLIHDENNHVSSRISDLLVEGSTISKITDSIKADSDTKVIDCEGKIISPGFIDTHRHLYHTAQKAKSANHTLVNYLPYGLFIATLYTTKDLFWGELAGALESIDAGTTTIVDHSNCNPTPDHPSAAIQAILTSGVRAIYCYTPPLKVHSWDPLKTDIDIFSHTTRSTYEKLARAGPFGNERVHVGHAVDALFLPGDVLKPYYTDLRDPAKGKAKLITSHGTSGPMVGNPPGAVQILAKHDLLGPDILISHANYPSQGDGELYAKSGAHMSATPSTELQLGWPPVALHHDHYHHASLGIDCHSWTGASIVTQMNLLLQWARSKRHEDLARKGLWSKNTGYTAEQVFNLGTVAGAKAVGLENEVGKLAVGMKADIAIFSATSPTMLCAAQEDPVAAIVLHSSPKDIDTVLVDGVVRKEGGELVDVCVEAPPLALAGGKGAVVVDVTVGRTLSWRDVAGEVLESKRVLDERMGGIDLDKGTEYVMDAYHFNRAGLVEEQRV